MKGENIPENDPEVKSCVVEWSRPIYFDWVKLETGRSKEGEEGKEGRKEGRREERQAGQN